MSFEDVNCDLNFRYDSSTEPELQNSAAVAEEQRDSSKEEEEEDKENQSSSEEDKNLGQLLQPDQQEEGPPEQYSRFGRRLRFSAYLNQYVLTER